MIEMVIWLVVIAVFVFRALKQNGTLDELFAGAKKRKENQAERVVYEQPEEGSGKKEKKKGPGDPGSEAHRFCGDYGCDRPRGGSAFL